MIEFTQHDCANQVRDTRRIDVLCVCADARNAASDGRGETLTPPPPILARAHRASERPLCASDRVRRRAMSLRRGATYLEYALLAALIGIVGAVGVKFYGEQILSLFKALGDKTAEVVPSTNKSEK